MRPRSSRNWKNCVTFRHASARAHSLLNYTFRTALDTRSLAFQRANKLPSSTGRFPSQYRWMCCSASNDMAHNQGGALRACNVTVRFHGITAIDGAPLALAAGDICGLIGPNGAGKTTLVNVLSGLETPSQGQVPLDDRPTQ